MCPSREGKGVKCQGYVRRGGGGFHNYGHGEMRNKKLINRLHKDGSSVVLDITLEKKRGRKGKNLLLLVTHPSTNLAQQGLTLFSGRIVVWWLYAERIFSNFSE